MSRTRRKTRLALDQARMANPADMLARPRFDIGSRIRSGTPSILTLIAGALGRTDDLVGT